MHMLQILSNPCCPSDVSFIGHVPSKPGRIFHAIEFGQDPGNSRLENVSKYQESIQPK
jgi:hypothetical protein